MVDTSNAKWFQRSEFLAAFFIFCFCSLYLPWKGTSFLLLPLYGFAWHKRHSYKIEKEVTLLFAALLGYALFFTLVSHVPLLSAKGVYDIGRGMLLFPVGVALSGVLLDKRNWMYGNWVALLLAAGSLFFPHRLGFYSYFSNPNNAAVLLVVFLLFLLPAFDKKWLELSYAPSYIGLGLALYLLFLTNGRGAWLGLTAALMTLLLFRCRFSWKVKLFSCLAVLSVFSLWFLEFNRKGFSLSHRGGLWEGLFNNTWQHNLLLGYGFNGTKSLIDELGLITRTAHNIFLEIFVTSGMVGLAVVFLIMFCFWRVFRRYSYPNNHLFFSGVIALVSFWVMGQFDLKFSSFRFFATNSFFLGLIYSQRMKKIPAKENPSD